MNPAGESSNAGTAGSPMKIDLDLAGKRFNYDWVFRDLSYSFASGNSYAILGPNGSGKSTLLQIIGGSLSLSEGLIHFTVNGKPVEEEHAYRHISFSAPAMELIEEFTLREFFSFQQHFKSTLPGADIPWMIHEIGLDHAADRPIRLYSSGMKQRVKLAQAIFSDAPALLLDEPCTNLDGPGIELYQSLIARHCLSRILIVASNNSPEYAMCTCQIGLKGPT
jgi:ABC-type multidrug transport system ATPase subunit